MDKYLMALISIGGIIYCLGGLLYIIHSAFNKSFLCKEYKDVATKVGFIIFLTIDIAMLPWTLMYCLFKAIIALFDKIIFKEDK